MMAAPSHRPRDFQVAAPDNHYGRGMPVDDSPDLQRVLALPRRPPVVPGSETSEALIEYEMRKYSRPNPNCECKQIDPQRTECITRLLPMQAWMLYEIGLVGGLLASAAVGSGKTLVNILATLALGVESPTLLLVPSSLVLQMITDYRLVAEHFRVPGIVVHTGKNKSWPRLVTGEPTLHVVGYNRLSLPDAAVMLERIGPKAIICDEVDALLAMTATRTIRVVRFMKDHPETLFCGWTGSMADKSISEFGHLMLYALKEGSPMPLDPKVAQDWGRHLDAVPNPCPAGALMQLCEPGEEVRSAFRRRLADTLGFVVSTENKVIVAGGTEEVRNVIRERQAPPIPDSVEKLLEQIRNGIRPDSWYSKRGRGDEVLADPMEQAACAQQAATGLIYYWEFPRGESDELIDEWFDARSEYHSEVRDQILKGDEYLDSPRLLKDAAMRAHGDAPSLENAPDPQKRRPNWDCASWPRWRDVEKRVEPEPSVHRVSDYLVRDSIDWAHESPGLVWYSMDEFARWMHELAPELPIHGGGKDAPDNLKKEMGDRSIIISMNSHGRGRNGLQFVFDRQHVVNTPASDRRWQQLLARAHRRGQKSLVVTTSLYLHTKEIKKAFDQACRRGGFVEQIFGERRKLLAGLE